MTRHPCGFGPPLPAKLPEIASGNDPPGQPGEQQLDRLLGRGCREHRAAVRLHQGPGRCQTALPQAPVQVAGKGSHVRLDVGIGNGGAAALVLPPDRRDDVRQGYGYVRQLALQERRQLLFVPGVDIGEQQVDGDSRRTLVCGVLSEALRDDCAEAGQFLLVQRNEDIAVLGDPLAHAQAVAPLGKRRRLHPVQVVVEPPIDPLDEEHVLEALRGEIEHSGAAPGMEHVDRHRAPQDQRADLAGADAGVGQRLEDPGLGVARCRGPFRDDQPAGDFRLLVLHHTDQVGESAARVYPYP